MCFAIIRRSAKPDLNRSDMLRQGQSVCCVLKWLRRPALGNPRRSFGYRRAGDEPEAGNPGSEAGGAEGARRQSDIAGVNQILP